MRSGADIALPNPEGDVDIPRLRAGGVALQAFAAFVPHSTNPDEALSTALSMLDDIVAACEANRNELAVTTSAAEVRAAVGSGRIAALLTVENGLAIEEDTANLEKLRRRGVRAMTLVHVSDLPWIASCTGGRGPAGGLSTPGERIVDAMCEMGMIVDVSHVHEKAFWKVAARTRRAASPLIASHSNAWELCRHPRNLKDDQIREIADQGGLIGINFFPLFLDEAYRGESDKRASSLFSSAADSSLHELGQTYREKMDGMSVSSERIVDHIDHMVAIAGVDCVAFGSDFDGILSTPDDVTGSDCYPVIIDELRSRGYREESIEKICWSNVLRVLEAAD